MRGMILAWLVSLSAGQQVFIPELVLEDQFEQVHDVKQHRGHVVVLIYGDRKSAEANRKVGEQIHVAFHPSAKGQPAAQARRAPVKPVEGAAAGTASPDVLAVPVALIGKVPPLVRKLIRTQIKNGSPEVPVWLDFNDTMKAMFPFKPGVPNVIVLDTAGRYRYAAAGTPTTEGMQRLFATIEALRKEALSSK